MAEISIRWTMMVLIMVCGIQDLRSKKIYLWLLLIGAVIMGACIPFSASLLIIDRIAGLAVGIVVIVISFATRGKIGLGDGILLCITGIGLGFWSNMELFAIALFLAAVTSIILLSFRIVDRKKSIPFVPFLFIGYLIIFLER